LQGFENTPEKEIAGYKQRDAMALTLHGFEQIAQAYAGIPGRKALLWATGGFPFLITTSGEVQSPTVFAQGGTYGGGRNDRSGNLGSLPESTAMLGSDVMAQLTPVYTRALAALTNADIAVYPIDARGLLTFSTGADVHRLDEVQQRELRQEHTDSHATMAVIADMTGGRAYFNTNDIAHSFKEAADDDQVYYTLGYYRAADAKKNKAGWQKLQVKLNKPGLQARARDGFMLSPDKPDSKEAKQADFSEAIQSPLEFSTVPVAVRLSKPSGPDPTTKKRNVAFEVRMPKGASLLDEAKYNIDVFAIAINNKGERAGQVGQNLAGVVPKEALTNVEKDGLNYRNLVQLTPGEYNLRFIVRDNLKGKIGSVILPLKIDE
jgi:VWFA-related protein